MENLVVIPARGGSKGIPRKNLRPLAGRPLIYYAITAAKACKLAHRVIVSTDDDEIALFAERFGASVIDRKTSLADDNTTLDPVILDATKRAEQAFSTIYTNVVTVQPTSPLIRSDEINTAIRMLMQEKISTVISVVNERHLYWGMRDGKPYPKYEQRVNRQELPDNFRETGAVIACTRQQLDTGTRIGQSIRLLEIPYERSLDIDTQNDLNLCESILNRKRIIFVVIGYPEVGLGHTYRAVMMANQFTQHELLFLCTSESQPAIDYIRGQNYPVEVCSADELTPRCLALEPQMVINDILDTEADYIETLKSAGIRVVNFEDLGPGHEHADLVINALYEQSSPRENTLVGPDYFCLRDEFIHLPTREDKNSIDRILLTFGGIDEGDLTVRCLSVIAPLCETQGIGVDIVTGPGYKNNEKLKNLCESIPSVDIFVAKATARISDYMQRADLAVTSGGRTVLELSALGVPTIVICQNLRETTHTFCTAEHGIINLGLRTEVSNETILETLENTVNDHSKYQLMRQKSKASDLRNGKTRVVNKILQVLEE